MANLLAYWFVGSVGVLCAIVLVMAVRGPRYRAAIGTSIVGVVGAIGAAAGALLRSKYANLFWDAALFGTLASILLAAVPQPEPHGGKQGRRLRNSWSFLVLTANFFMFATLIPHVRAPLAAAHPLYSLRLEAFFVFSGCTTLAIFGLLSLGARSRERRLVGAQDSESPSPT